MAKVAIMGSDGSMGRLLAKFALGDGELEVVAAFTVDVSPNVGTDIGILASGTASGVTIQPMEYFKEIMESSRPDVLIDFTLPEGTETSTKWAITEGFPAVIGTTGLSEGFLSWVAQAAEEKNVTVVISSNFAMGMNIFFKVSAELAKLLPGWDVEIIETHHHRKRDSPSGTALRIASGIAKALEVDLEE
ncbi:MAG TPA: 4-hydroxy-tetrahydrodipicolinate reductase, partial [Candidatus Lokiarchaeia archaeon]|nr:4-hydroxy-tetrahydrodipicolinate reductase [Candidatus Lokiarchaeia archaeon]